VNSCFSHQVLWTFSIYLESVAILPQLFLVSKTGEAESITSHYLFALGAYRALYLLNWVYRYYSEDYLDLIAIVAGVVQTALYCDFFYLYITRGKPVDSCGLCHNIVPGPLYLLNWVYRYYSEDYLDLEEENYR
ncbi:ER lumen protein-retaining receptor, partial [Diaphorina citri]|uniref:ER lumen protein-retaining receptor n=1 Tax=Diaphorina citri TaxID=121845 RepID=A0A1S3DK21_DIACI